MTQEHRQVDAAQNGDRRYSSGNTPQQMGRADRCVEECDYGGEIEHSEQGRRCFEDEPLGVAEDDPDHDREQEKSCGAEEDFPGASNPEGDRSSQHQGCRYHQDEPVEFRPGMPSSYQRQEEVKPGGQLQKEKCE